MAIVAIEVQVDEKGAATGIQKVDNQFKQIEGAANSAGAAGKNAFTLIEGGANKAAAAGSSAFKGITKESQRSFMATNLITRELGIEMPKAVKKFLASSSLIGPMMNAAFNVSIIAAVGAAVIAMIPKIQGLADSWGGYTEGVRAAYAEQVKLNEAMLTAFDSKTIGRAFINQTRAQLDALDQERNGLLGVEMTWKQYATAWLDGNLNGIAATDRVISQRKRLGEIYDEEQKLQKRLTEQVTKLGTLEKASHEEVAAAAKKSASEQAAAAKQLGEIANQWSKKGLDPIQQLNEEFVQAYHKALEEAQKSGLGRAAIEQNLATLIAGYSRQHGKLVEDEADKVTKASQESYKKQEESAKQAAEVIAQLEHERAQISIDAAKMEGEAADLSLPPWQRAYAEINSAHAHMVEQINEKEKEMLSKVQEGSDEWVRIEQTVQDERLAADHLTNAKIIDEHRKMIEEQGAQWESLFDDITGGNLGKRILTNMKKFFFQILASWISTTKGMGNATSTGLLGGLIFGNTGGMLGGGGGVPIPGMTGITNGSGSAGSVIGTGSGGDVSTPTYGSASSIPASGFMPGALTTSASGVPIGGAPTSTAGSTQQAGGGSLLGALLGGVFGKSKGGSASGGLGSRLASTGVGLAKSLGPMAAMAIGQKFGGTSAAVGVGLSTLGIMAAAGNAQALAAVSALGLAPALLAGGAGALMGFGVGMQHGKVAGSITGVAGGLGTAGIMAMLGVGLGPVGWIAAGVIGLLGGLFGGILGGSKRKKQALAIESQAEPQINSLLESYRNHQIDGTSALQQLDTMQQALQEQLHALKGEGDKIYTSQTLPKLLAARTEIQMYETERTRRGRLDFSPPMFHEGGFVGGAKLAGWRMGNGEVASILKEGEFVSSPQSTARNRGVLEALNRGENVGGRGGDTIYISAVDAPSFGAMLRNHGGWDAFKAVHKQQTREGNGL